MSSHEWSVARCFRWCLGIKYHLNITTSNRWPNSVIQVRPQPVSTCVSFWYPWRPVCVQRRWTCDIWAAQQHTSWWDLRRQCGSTRNLLHEQSPALREWNATRVTYRFSKLTQRKHFQLNNFNRALDIGSVMGSVELLSQKLYHITCNFNIEIWMSYGLLG